jgi:hypothetical protein
MNYPLLLASQNASLVILQFAEDQSYGEAETLDDQSGQQPSPGPIGEADAECNPPSGGV